MQLNVKRRWTEKVLLADSYRLGVKKSNIRLPLEHSSMSAVFGKKETARALVRHKVPYIFDFLEVLSG